MLAKLFYMGGYAAYVWPAYIIVILILVINAWKTMRKLTKMLKQMNRLVDEKSDAEAAATNNYSF